MFQAEFVELGVLGREIAPVAAGVAAKTLLHVGGIELGLGVGGDDDLPEREFRSNS